MACTQCGLHPCLNRCRPSLRPQAMGLEGSSDGVATAADINADTFEQALAASPPLFVDTYKQRGKPLSFAADKRVGRGLGRVWKAEAADCGAPLAYPASAIPSERLA